MIRFDAWVSKMKFKKALIIYLIALLLAGTLSAGFLAYKFRDKLTFAYEYHRISEKAEHDSGGLESLKSDLSNLSQKSSDIVDILILNGQNQILYSAKNSSFSAKGTLQLTANAEKKEYFLMDQDNPEAYFWLVKNDKLTLSMAMLGFENEIKQDYKDHYFYEKNYGGKQVYLLSYITHSSSGNKVYFISDIKPVPGGKFYVKAVAALGMLFFMLYWVWLALWVYAQALKSKLNAPMWGIITLFTNLAGLFVFLIYRQGHQTCYQCGTLQNKGNIYCTCCGTRISQSCEACGGLVGNKDAFCKNCGHKLKKDNEI